MEETWNLSDIHDEKDTDKKIGEVKSLVEKFKSYREILNKDISAKKLREIIDLYEDISLMYGRIYAYFQLKSTENTSDTSALAKLSYLGQVGTDISTETLFFSLWLSKLPKRKAKELASSDELKAYEYFIMSAVKSRRHMLPEPIEKIISMKSIVGMSAFFKLYEIHTNSFMFDMNGKRLTKEEIVSKFQGKDRDEREQAYKIVFERYGKESVLLSEMYRSIVLDWRTEGVKIRKHKSPIGVRNFANDVGDKAVEALLNTIRKSNGLMQRYFKLKYEINKRKGNDYPYSRYHVYAPYDMDSDSDYSYARGKELVLDTLKKFDMRMYDAAKRIFDAKHVHSHPKPAKRSGAFCYGINNVDTPYILLNHTDKLRDVFTIIHEFGHGVHDVLAQKQPNSLYHPCLPMAETASVFGEMLLAERLLKESGNKDEKIAILMKLLDDVYQTLQRQAYFVIFEKEAHEMILKGATKEELDELYLRLLKEQFGDMEIPDGFKHEWNYIPHIHETPFYCYAYCWGKLMVLALYRMYEEEGEPFKDRYVELLSTGGSKSPRDMLKILGINPSSERFWQKGMKIIEKQIDELEKLSKQ